MKIVVVDDEIIIREWMQFSISQHSNCEFAGAAENGKQALILIDKVRPDVVMTDIKMPVMDGLLLLSEIKKRYPKTLVVLLTAFSEFDLARQALREGADEYLLKTEVSSQAMEELIERLQKKLSMSYEQERNYEPTIIRDILKKKRPLEEAEIIRLEEYQVNFRKEGIFSIALWKQDIRVKKPIIPNCEKIQLVTSLEMDEDSYVLLGNISSRESEIRKLEILRGYAEEIAEKNHCMLGVSLLGNSLSDVYLTIFESITALSRGYLKSKMQVYYEENRGKILLEKTKEWKSRLDDFYDTFVKSSGKEQLLKLENMSLFAINSEIYSAQHWKGFFLKLLDFLSLHGENTEGSVKGLTENMRKQIEEGTTLESSCKVLLEVGGMFIKNSDLDESSLSKGVLEAVNYIRQNYQTALSLEILAEKVHLNPEYLSRLFKEEVGCTYSTFLTDTRLNQAAGLLLHTNEKVQKIAEQVGYPNVSYFSTVFKKYFACNPYEYRRNQK